MKNWLKIIITALTFVGFIILGFYIDSLIINFILEQFPAKAAEWLGVIEVVLWFIAFWCTAGLIIGISGLITKMVMKILGE